MKCFVFTLVITLVAGSLGCFAQQVPAAVSARPSPSDAERLIAQSQAVVLAEKTKDEGMLQRLLSNDFQQVGSEGTLHEKRDLLDDARVGKLTDFMLYNFQVLPVDENAAIVTFDAVIRQPEGDDDLAPRYQHVSDVWVKQADQWRLRFQQATARRPVD